MFDDAGEEYSECIFDRILIVSILQKLSIKGLLSSVVQTYMLSFFGQVSRRNHTSIERVVCRVTLEIYDRCELLSITQYMNVPGRLLLETSH